MDAGKGTLFQDLPGAAHHPGRRCLALIGLLLAAFWALDLGLLATPGGAQPRRPTKAADHRPAATAAPDKQFTIVKIEPDAKSEEVRIFFSKPVPLEGLQGNLRLLPLSKIDWRHSAMTRKADSP